MLWLFIILLLSEPVYSSVVCESGRYPPKNRSKLDEYIVNLDVEPFHRWDDIIKAKKDGLLDLFTVFTDFDKEYFHGYLMKIVDNYLVYIDDDMPSPYKEEIKGISNISGISTARLVLYNIFYEIFTFCTSILAYNDDDQALYHARNMDFGLFLGWDSPKGKWKISEALRPLTVALDFRRANVTVYKAVSFVGYLGVLTAMKPGKFSLTVNERFSPDGGFLGVLMWILGFQKLNWLSFFTRDVMERSTSFAEAKARLEKDALIAPVYFILGGVNKSQADIITRSRESLIDDRNMTAYHNISLLNIPINSSYLLVTDQPKLNNSIQVSKFSNHDTLPQSVAKNHGLLTNRILSEIKEPKLQKNDFDLNKRRGSNFTPGNIIDIFMSITSRKRRHSVKNQMLEHISAPTSGEDTWFLVETNYDWWKTPFFIDNRRAPAIQCLKQAKLTKKIDFSSLYDVLSTRPILNKLTVYTTLMNVKEGVIETYLRDCADPCPPW